MKNKTSRIHLKVDRKELAKLGQALRKIIGEIPAAKRRDLSLKMASFQTRMRRLQEDYRNPAELLIAASLVNQNRWNPVVQSRLRSFRAEHRGVKSIAQLRHLLARMSDRDIYTKVLHFGTGSNPKNYRAPLLRGLAEGFDRYRRKFARGRKRGTDFETLRAWAREPDPAQALQDAVSRKIPGLGPKLIDWLRMFGGDFPTVPADVYTLRGMRRLGLGDPARAAEFIARLFSISPRTLDLVFQRSKNRRS